MKYQRIFVLGISIISVNVVLPAKAAQFDATMNILDMLDKQVKAQDAATQKELEALEKTTDEMMVKVEKEQAKVGASLEILSQQADAKTLDRKSLEKTLRQFKKLKGKSTRAIDYIDQNFIDQEIFMDKKNQQLLEEIAHTIKSTIKKAQEVLKKDRDNDLRSFLKAKKRLKK